MSKLENKIMQLNSNCNEIGAGMLANLKELASQELTRTNYGVVNSCLIDAINSCYDKGFPLRVVLVSSMFSVIALTDDEYSYLEPEFKLQLYLGD